LRYAGEGFDCPALDTLFLAALIAQKGRLMPRCGMRQRGLWGAHRPGWWAPVISPARSSGARKDGGDVPEVPEEVRADVVPQLSQPVPGCEP
jgi:hypothetical protein